MKTIAKWQGPQWALLVVAAATLTLGTAGIIA